MTRLAKEDIEAMEQHCKDLDNLLKMATGNSLLEIGACAMNKGWSGNTVKTAVVPVTAGLGIISGFCEKVKEILNYLGAAAFVTVATDMAGIQEAIRKGAEVVFMADDETFSAFHFKKGIYSDNSVATGRGFAAALYLASGGQKDMEVLVLGAGPVGRGAMDFFSEKGIQIILVEPDSDRMKFAREKYPGIKTGDAWSIGDYAFILEATPIPDLIKKSQVTHHTIIAAPGVPFGVTPEAAEKAGRVIHNILELGVATMLVEVS
jgi:pyrrolysine biosynthesis protein PylD